MRNGRGAMVWQIGQERYPGDPQGRAAKQGVKEGFAVTWYGRSGQRPAFIPYLFCF